MTIIGLYSVRTIHKLEGADQIQVHTHENVRSTHPGLEAQPRQLQPATARSQSSCTVAPSRALHRARGSGRLTMPDGGSRSGSQRPTLRSKAQAVCEPDAASARSSLRRRVRQVDHDCGARPSWSRSRRARVIACAQVCARRRRARRGAATPLNGVPRPRVRCHVPEWASHNPGNRPDC